MSDVNEQITSAMESALAGQETAPPQAVTPPQEVQAPKAINLNDDALVSYKVGNQEFSRPWKEILQTQVLLPGDYTKKTQALARDRDEFEKSRASAQEATKAWENERAQIIAAIQDPRKLGALYLAALSKAQGGNPQQVQNPQQNQNGAPLTQEQLIAAVNHRLTQWSEEQRQAVAQERISQDLDTFMSGIKKGSPIEDLPGVDDYIYGQVELMKPSSVEEAKQFAKTVFDDYSAKFSAKFVAEKKADEIAKSKLNNGIEPPGGSIVLPQAQQFKGHNDPARVEAILQYMQQALAGSA